MAPWSTASRRAAGKPGSMPGRSMAMTSSLPRLPGLIRR
jgi:hypothetical protein